MPICRGKIALVSGLCGKEIRDTRLRDEGYWVLPIAMLPVGLNNNSVFVSSPRCLVDVRIQMMSPSLTALLLCAMIQVAGNGFPFLSTILVDLMVLGRVTFNCKGEK